MQKFTCLPDPAIPDTRALFQVIVKTHFIATTAKDLLCRNINYRNRDISGFNAYVATDE